MQEDYKKNKSTPGKNILQGEKRRGRGRPLSPLRPVTVITQTGPIEFSVEEISAEKLGWKAYGLSSLPSEWVPPFFVIAASCFEGECSDETVDAYVSECFNRAGMNKSGLVMVRSSGTSETMQYRGRLKSADCISSQATAMIRNLIPQLPNMPDGKVHWIIQEYVKQKRMGHLSNERHLRKEKRDWIVGFEPQEGRQDPPVKIAVRYWRDGKDLPGLDLSCTSEFAAPLRLKLVAMWATQLSSRTHFEWVWDGKVIRIVQADEADPAIGFKPRSLLPKRICTLSPPYLQIFRVASDQDYENYGKLRNAKLYQNLNYNMPLFYVLDDPRVMDNLLSGFISPEFESDLIELTKRSLIIRTDGVGIQKDKREMLPRSDELRSYEIAREWLLDNFKSQIEQNELKDDNLCLISHHFIPSVASAWARAVPGERIVRIDSLWGIPEGLYFYSHDTFEIDTKEVDVDTDISLLNYEVVGERLRYKGIFIASNENGKWIRHKTVPPYDWNRSIRKEGWLFEIAYTTRQIAEREGYAVSVMWFIDNHPQATPHKIIPWFHSKSELSSPNAAPRQKLSGARDFRIKAESDWQRLQEDLQSGKYIERIIVEPEDPELIRNPDFAKRLAALAKDKNIVVVLAGSILSHPYYVLKREGAQVECIDLFGVDEDIDDYNKIVRDEIPYFIEKRGERTQTVQLIDGALVAALQQKLVEEAFEALDAKSGPDLNSELADVQEVVRALCRELGQSIADIEAEREKKAKRRGGFEKGLMLIKTATPHSIQKKSIGPQIPTLGLTQQSSELVISDASKLPTKPLYRRSDLRQINQQLEKLFIFETEINRTGRLEEALDFSMPMDNQRQQDFNLKVELIRTRSSLRVIIRLRMPRPLQLKLDFSE
ncbi:MAG: hypothetical protein ACOZF2_11360 [Thermodesulfobacteriota bacterium]